MKNGKYSKNNTKRRLRWSKQFVLLASVVVLLVGAIGGSLAYLFTNTDPVVNTFIPGEVVIEVVEPGWEDGDLEKSNVTIKNTGNVDAIIRAMIVVNWQDAQGNIYPGAPVAGTDYTITGLPGEGWTGGTNGWYVYGEAVAPGGSTGILFSKCSTATGTAPAGYHLVVDVIAEAIQAVGSDQNW